MIKYTQAGGSIKTTNEWWVTTKNDKTELTRWLGRQYVGEVTAASRIERVAQKYDTGVPELQKIAKEERKHALWVRALLSARGIDTPEPETITDTEDRYWKEALAPIQDFETACAVGAHAEEMRLERIRCISGDPDAPEDIRKVFTRILKDEKGHAECFRRLAGERAYLETANAHEKGMQALGLVS